MRAEIRRNDLGGNGSINLAQWWFHNMTQYMDLLLIIQRELAIKIVMMQDKDQRSNMEKMCVISVVCLCVVIISIIIIYVIYILTDIIQKYSICIAERCVVVFSLFLFSFIHSFFPSLCVCLFTHLYINIWWQVRAVP